MRQLFAGLALFLAAGVAVAGDNGAGARPYVVSLMHDRGIFCSGVTIRPGLVLTAQHCVDGQAEIRLAPGGTVGTVLANGDGRFDLALMLFPDAVCPCAPIASREAAMDESVVTVGYPRGLAQVVTLGTSQGVQGDENKELPYGGPRLLTTAAVTGGNSGGGVFVLRNGRYQLAGILVEGLGHIALAMPVEAIEQFLQPAL